ncbi:protein hairless-like [Anopheles nili]|uniref:protein hairless-like n=1 Tax=Anopheles nili TaxID=185578 RepID=UPI00237AA567|nr:protein hairless-like [Anopheles nili]
MYVINPAPASQDLQATASTYTSPVVSHHRPESPGTLEQQQQRKDILSQILTKCNADMSEQAANFSSPGERTPPRSTPVAVKEEKTGAPPSPTASDVSCQAGKQASSSEVKPSPPDSARGEARSPLALNRSASPDGSPLSTTSSSNVASLSPASSSAAELPKTEPVALSVSSVANFSSVVHPKERALKSIAAAAAANERNSASNGVAGGPPEGPVVTPGKPVSKYTPVGGSSSGGVGGGRTIPNGGTPSTPTGAGGGHGGRWQFFKDGKCILVLARAREGEKTSWISVPRKTTFWPPTVSSTSANFHKHESSTSLSFSDDNSSIQSSPWQRDHCWKQANPRPNISRELSLFYFRPANSRIRVTREICTWLRRKRRRPYEPSLPPDTKPTADTPVTIKKEKNSDTEEPATSGGNERPAAESPPKCNGVSPMDTSEPSSGSVEKSEDDGSENRKDVSRNGPTEDDYKHTNGHHPLTNGGSSHLRASRRKRPEGKDLSAIVQMLTEQQQQQARTANSSASVASSTCVGPFRLGTIADRGSNGTGSFRGSLFASTSASQHVSPRKRILRELEKVSLEDGASGGSNSTKRSRPKSGGATGTPVIVTATTATPLSTVTTNGAGSPLNGASGGNSSSSSRTNGHVNGAGSIVNGTAGKHLTNGAASSSSISSHPSTVPAPVSRPFSSYSINSLLGHSSSSSSEPSSSVGSGSASEARKADASVASVTSTASHHLYHHSQQPLPHQHHHPLSPHQPYHSPYLGKEPLSGGSRSPTMIDPQHYSGQLGSNRYGGYGAKKRSPSYGGGNGSATSPGATSGGSGSADPPYGGTIRSPDLSPSPEHHAQHALSHHPHHSAHPAHHGQHHGGPSGSASSGFTRYRQHPYGGSPSSFSSAPSSSRFSPSPSTNDSTSTPPYSGSVAGAGGTPGGARTSATGSYRSAYHLGGQQGHSPPASNGSPQHYSRASPLNFGRTVQQHSSPPPPPGPHHQHHHHHRGAAAAAASSSPRSSPSGSSNGGSGATTTSHVATTPTSAMASLSTGTSIRTVPKKTAALRQPFSGGHSPSAASSPSRERSNSNTSNSSVKKESNPDGVDSVDGSLLSGHGHYGVPSSSVSSHSPSGGVIRPSTVIASPTSHHPVANPFYPLYPAQLAASTAGSSMNAAAVAAAAAAAAAASSVPFHPASLSYYQQMYTAATMAAYRAPLWMHYPGLPPVATPHAPPHLVQPHPPPPPPPSASSVPTSTGLAADRRIDRIPVGSTPAAPPTSVAADSLETHRTQHSSLATPSSAAALNYSVTALTSSSRATVNGDSAFSFPPGSNWPSGGGAAYQHHHATDHSIAAAAAAVSGTAATVKEEPSNGECALEGLRSYVPLNLSKH